MVYRSGLFFIFGLILMISGRTYSQFAPDNNAFIHHIESKNEYKILSNEVATGLPAINITHTIMDYSVDPQIRAISGSVKHQFFVNKEKQAITLRLANELTPTVVSSSLGAISFQHDGYNLELTFPQMLIPQELYDITISYSGTPPDNGYYLQDYHGEIPVLATFAEPYGAGDWWPCNPGLTDKVDSLDIILTFPEQFLAGANGVMVENIVNGDGTRTMHFKHRFPIVNYNIAFAVSEYVHYSDEVNLDGSTFMIENLAWQNDLQEAQSHTSSLPQVFHMLSDYFGDYPFKDEKYGHMQWMRGGAMEHQTMTSTCCWNYELLVHELGHQWFGNMVTLNSWHDIFLNEGFATYISGLAYESLFPEKDYWNIWKTQKRDHIISEPNGSIYVHDTTDKDRIFDARLSYNKGAMLLHMLRMVIGEEAFFQGIKDYLYHPANHFGFATMQSFIQSMETAADTTLTEFFDDWYYGEGYPTYTIEYTAGCSALFAVTLHQETSHSSVDFFEMPVTLHLKSSYADTIITINNTQNHEHLLFPLEFCVEEVIFDPHVSIVAGPPSYVTGINDNDISKKVTISPNPISDYATITWEGVKFDLLNVYSQDLSLVYSKRLDPNKTHFRYKNDLKGSGLYILELLSDEQIVVKKVIIK